MGIKIMIFCKETLFCKYAVKTLKLKSMNHLLMLFEKVVHEIYENDSLPKSNESWLRPPYTRKQLNELYRINPLSMNSEEILLRIGATDYGSRYNGAFF